MAGVDQALVLHGVALNAPPWADRSTPSCSTGALAGEPSSGSITCSLDSRLAAPVRSPRLIAGALRPDHVLRIRGRLEAGLEHAPAGR